jgi:hypothetical protein
MIFLDSVAYPSSPLLYIYNCFVPSSSLKPVTNFPILESLSKNFPVQEGIEAYLQALRVSTVGVRLTIVSIKGEGDTKDKDGSDCGRLDSNRVVTFCPPLDR